MVWGLGFRAFQNQAYLLEGPYSKGESIWGLFGGPLLGTSSRWPPQVQGLTRD